jgi:dihydroorotate dehydrogenase (fumarate)
MDLFTRYLGLALRNPLLASASPLSNTLDGIRRLADAGVGAVVLYSLFEEQLRREAEKTALMVDQGSESYPESLTYFPSTTDQGHGPRRYLLLLERAAGAVDIPIIGSLNATAPGSWARYARSMQDAGASAVEVNLYHLPGDPWEDGQQVEQRHLDVLAAVKGAVRVPVAMKLSPFFSATADIVHRLDAAGADGLVLFNRFLQPDIDLDTLTTVPGVTLSTSAEMRVPMTWIALLSGRTRASLAASTGVEHAADVIKYLLAGADVVQCASALLRHGPQYAGVLLDGLSEWMGRKGYDSLSQVRGLLALPDGEDRTARERADYVGALHEANSRAYGTW